MRTFRIWLICLIGGVPGWLAAQDMHFSQPRPAAFRLSPALAGAYEPTRQLALGYRSQWQAVPVAYETLVAGYSQKIALPGSRGHYLAAGGRMAYDQAGDGNLSWLQVAGSAAFHLQLSEGQYLSTGLEGSAGQRGFSPAAFQFGDQFADNLFDPSSPTAEQLERTVAGYASWGAGLAWAYRPVQSRFRLHLALGAFHLNQPVLSFLGGEGPPLPIRYALSVGAVLPATDQASVLASLLWQQQGVYREALLLGGARLHLDAYGLPAIALSFEGGYRLSDALVLSIGGQYREWELGLSYDINVSPFQQATNGRGGAELWLQYSLTAVEPPPVFKACPIF